MRNRTRISEDQGQAIDFELDPAGLICSRRVQAQKCDSKNQLLDVASNVNFLFHDLGTRNL